MLDPRRPRRDLERRCGARSRATRRTRSSAGTSPSSTRRRTSRGTIPAEELRLAIRDGRYEEEGWRVRKDGTRFWANVVITPVYDEAGDLVGFGKVSRDLTARRVQEEQMRATDERAGGREPTARRVPAPRVERARLRDLPDRSVRPHPLLERRRAAPQGVRGGRDHRPALLGLLHPGGPGPAPSGARARRGHPRGPLRRGGLARPQGPHAFLGEGDDHRDPRRGRPADRVREGDARPHVTSGRPTWRSATRSTSCGSPTRSSTASPPSRRTTSRTPCGRSPASRSCWSAPGSHRTSASTRGTSPTAAAASRGCSRGCSRTPAPGGRSARRSPSISAVPSTHALADLAALIAERDAAVTVALPAGATVRAATADVRVVLQNLLSNALRFSDAGTPEVRVAAERGRRRLARHRRGQRAGHRAGRAGADLRGVRARRRGGGA